MDTYHKRQTELRKIENKLYNFFISNWDDLSEQCLSKEPNVLRKWLFVPSKNKYTLAVNVDPKWCILIADDELFERLSERLNRKKGEPGLEISVTEDLGFVSSLLSVNKDPVYDRVYLNIKKTLKKKDKTYERLKQT